jgi:hypothetical protein
MGEHGVPRARETPAPLGQAPEDLGQRPEKLRASGTLGGARGHLFGRAGNAGVGGEQGPDLPKRLPAPFGGARLPGGNGLSGEASRIFPAEERRQVGLDQALGGEKRPGQKSRGEALGEDVIGNPLDVGAPAREILPYRFGFLFDEKFVVADDEDRRIRTLTLRQSSIPFSDSSMQSTQ